MPIYFDQRNFSQGNSSQGNSISPQNTLPGYSPVLSFSQTVARIKLFLDMDGVLTDFTGACEKLGENMVFLYSTDKERFWKRVSSAGTGFWADMPWMEGGKELHGFLKSSGFSPKILSALPNPDLKAALAHARKGKRSWLRRELGICYAEEAILCFRPEKALHSGISRVLIDDNSDNIREWEEAGGIGILRELPLPKTLA